MNHERLLRCDTPREVALAPHLGTWLPALAHAWRDLLDHGAPLYVALVRPPPFAVAPDHFVHLIVVQHPLPELTSIATAVVDDLIDPWSSAVSAVAMPRRSTPTVLLDAMDLLPLCPPAGPAWRCSVIDPTGMPTPDDHPIEFHDGAAWLISIAWNAPPQDLLLDDDASILPVDHIGLLQLGLHRVRSTLKGLPSEEIGQTCPSSPPVVDPGQSDPVNDITLHMSSVIQVFEWIDGHLILPDYVFPDDTSWPVGCSEWLSLTALR